MNNQIREASIYLRSEKEFKLDLISKIEDVNVAKLKLHLIIFYLVKTLSPTDTQGFK